MKRIKIAPQNNNMKLKLNSQLYKNRSHICVYHYAQLLYTTQHRKVPIIFPLNFQTNIIAWMLSSGGESKTCP